MSFLKTFIIFLIYINSLLYALQCTTDCRFPLNLTIPFKIPAECNTTVSAEQCEVDISISNMNSDIMISFTTPLSNYVYNSDHFAMIQLLDSGSITFSYSISHRCKNEDDCAIKFVKNNMLDILDRPPINYQGIRDELFPLLSSNPSTENVDLICFDSKENVHQCSIASKPGACQVSHYLTSRKQTLRSCDNELFISSQSVTIYDSNNLAYFSIKCNRSLCNGPMTLQAVKEVMFKYNVTKTIEGQLNNGLRLSLSSTFLISIFIICLII